VIIDDSCTSEGEISDPSNNYEACCQWLTAYNYKENGWWYSRLEWVSLMCIDLSKWKPVCKLAWNQLYYMYPDRSSLKQYSQIYNYPCTSLNDEKFRFSNRTCYDWTSMINTNITSCKPSLLRKKYAENFCDDHCSEDENGNEKCGVSNWSVSKSCE
jgi:hypothetical protein